MIDNCTVRVDTSNRKKPATLVEGLLYIEKNPHNSVLYMRDETEQVLITSDGAVFTEIDSDGHINKFLDVDYLDPDWFEDYEISIIDDVFVDVRIHLIHK